jgi:hypothetical protein
MKNKIKNILKEKKLKRNKLDVGGLDTVLLCIIHSIIIENVLFEDGDVNIFCIFNSTQVFLYLKKQLLLRANILAIILLHNGYFF